MLTTQAKLLKRAAQICGGYGSLCRRLGVDESQLRLWVAERSVCPESVLVKAVEILLEEIARREAK